MSARKKQPTGKDGADTKRPTSLTAEKTRRVFIERLRGGYSVAAACRAAKVSREHAYTMRERDKAFAADWDSAIDEGGDTMEDRLLDIGNSPLPGNVTSLIFLLKGRRPEKYRERSDMTNSDGSLAGIFAEAMHRSVGSLDHDRNETHTEG